MQNRVHDIHKKWIVKFSLNMKYLIWYILRAIQKRKTTPVAGLRRTRIKEDYNEVIYQSQQKLLIAVSENSKKVFVVTDGLSH
jgi:hypothetical protein